MLAVLGHSCNPNTGEVKAGRSPGVYWPASLDRWGKLQTIDRAFLKKTRVIS